ncbi:MAG: hypothetical protein NTV80_20675, partial [Verrucomicrobia bacterium]|nr:hypothetical protein [Verrucomicrobiota bacterium]
DGWENGGAEAYRCLLFSSGLEVMDAQNVNVVRKGVTADEARQVLKEKGKLSSMELVRLRVRYFSDGLVLGSQEFVESIFTENRARFGSKRKTGARRLKGGDGALFSMRDLRKNSLG